MSPARSPDPSLAPSDVEIPAWDRPDRRAQLRRESDVSRTFDNWAASAIAERGKRIAKLAAGFLTAGAVAGALLTLVAWVGIGIDGVPQKLARVERGSIERDSINAADRAALAVRVGKLEDQSAAVVSALRDVQETQRYQASMSCIIARQVAPTAAPEICPSTRARETQGPP
jgi:hypothetical protein